MMGAQELAGDLRGLCRSMDKAPERTLRTEQMIPDEQLYEQYHTISNNDHADGT